MDTTAIWLEVRDALPYVVGAGVLGAAVAAACRSTAWRDLLRRISPQSTFAREPVAASQAFPTAERAAPTEPRWLSLSSGRVGMYAAAAAALIAVPLSLLSGGSDSSAHVVRQVSSFGEATVALADGGLKLGAVRSLAAPGKAAGNELSDAAWLFGALVSGGRLAEAYAMLSPEAQKALPPEQFKTRFGETRMLQGSNDAPWRIPGSNVFLFSLSDRVVGGAVKGEARLSFAFVDGQWRLAALKLSEATPEQRAAAR